MIIRNFIKKIHELQDMIGDILGATTIYFVTKDGEKLIPLSFQIVIDNETGEKYIAVNIA